MAHLRFPDVSRPAPRRPWHGRYAWLFLLATMLVLPRPAAARMWPFRDHPVCKHGDEACELVNRWYREGRAAGNLGDYYDNRDHGHSRLDPDTYERLAFISYGDTTNRGRGWGAQHELLPHVVLGNSSTAAGARNGGSNARLAYVNDPRGIEFLYTQYRGNNLYVYPEHRDHDPGHNGDGGYGDLLPVNTPYMILSQGSSGTDLPFLRALFHTLAAFRPEVKRRLEDEGLLMPTLQMILRWSNTNVQSDERYLTGAAHPTVFRGEALDPERMVRLAQEMTLHTLPPLVQVEVVEEEAAVCGRDFFEPPGSVEALADTPGAIARVHRDRAWAKRLTVSARSSRDPNGRPLRVQWVILRGDPARIDIRTRDGGVEAEITVRYHERRPIAPGDPMESNRVDIGVFVSNGVSVSAPGFVTVYTLDNEERVYDSSGRILEINYTAGVDDVRLADRTRAAEFWEGLVNAVRDGIPDDLGRRLLAQYLDAREWTLLEGVVIDAAEIPARMRQLEKEKEWAESTDRQMRRALDGATAEVTEAQDAHQTLRSSNTQADLDAARARAEQWTLIQKETEEEVRRLGKELEALRGSLDEKLRTRDRFLHTSPRELLIRAFEDVKRDLSFYPRHGPTLRARDPGLGPPAGATEVRELIDDLVDEDVFVRVAPHRVDLDGDRVAAGLAAFDVDQIHRLNLAILREMVFPGVLEREQGPNYVDPRLTATKNWRDVYAYDESGKLHGWTRTIRGEDSHRRTRETYSADGWRVTARDADGRVTSAERVEYRRGSRGTLRAAPIGAP